MILSKAHRFPRTFWIANIMELFERWGWYGMFIPLTLYLTGSTDTGALGFTQAQKGVMVGTVVMILYFLPTITGAIADKFGYKKMLILSYLILSSGYFLMGIVESYGMFWVVFLYVGVGAGLFKPVVSATIARTTNDSNSSIGFGIFYMIVNIGAFIGPFVAALLRQAEWQWVFNMSAVAILFNLVLVFFFYKEPEVERSDEPLRKSIITIFKNIYLALSDIKFLLFLIIIVGFWTMYNQLFYTLPVFIEQWMDTRSIYAFVESISPALASFIGTDEGTISPDMIVNFDALYIVIFQVLISALVAKYRPMNTMVTGILICTIGIGLWFMTQNATYLFISIFIFAVGEMTSSPKILEYIGKIAPKDKVALYMGCYYIPMSLGNFFAGLISGNVYQGMSDKVTLLQREVEARGLDIPVISENFTQNQYLNESASQMGMTLDELTNFLWVNYNPGSIWMVISGIGVLTVISLVIYKRVVKLD